MVTSWNFDGADWDDPDPADARYTEALYGALNERLWLLNSGLIGGTSFVPIMIPSRRSGLSAYVGSYELAGQNIMIKRDLVLIRFITQISLLLGGGTSRSYVVDYPQADPDTTFDQFDNIPLLTLGLPDEVATSRFSSRNIFDVAGVDVEIAYLFTATTSDSTEVMSLSRADMRKWYKAMYLVLNQMRWFRLGFYDVSFVALDPAYDAYPLQGVKLTYWKRDTSTWERTTNYTGSRILTSYTAYDPTLYGTTYGAVQTVAEKAAVVDCQWYLLPTTYPGYTYWSYSGWTENKWNLLESSGAMAKGDRWVSGIHGGVLENGNQPGIDTGWVAWDSSPAGEMILKCDDFQFKNW